MINIKFLTQISLVIALSLVLEIPSLAQEDKTDILYKSIIATVDSIEITAEEFIFSYEYGPAFIKRKENSKAKHLNYLIKEKLLALDGYSNQIETSEIINRTIKAFSADLATEEMYKEKILNKIKNTDEEIDSVIIEKQIEVSFRWLFSDSDSIITDYLYKLQSGVSFDNIFETQIIDSINVEDRSLEISRYTLGRKNPVITSIIDTMRVKSFSNPIKVDDGWYILFLDNFIQKNLITETEHVKLREEAIRAVTKRKMDEHSAEYVDSLMRSNNPMVMNSVFLILRSYLGKMLLDTNLYEKWELEKKLQQILSENNIYDPEIMKNLDLVRLNNTSITISQFLEWFWVRDQYIKFNKTSLETFSQSLSSIIYQMVRDELLTEQAYSEGFNVNKDVLKQINWWKDKIVSSAVKNKIKNSVIIEQKEIERFNKESDKQNNSLESEYLKKIFRKLNKLKKKYEITINKNILNSLVVSEENNKKAIDFYTVKKGGLIPRTPYPTIDFEWSLWE